MFINKILLKLNIVFLYHKFYKENNKNIRHILKIKYFRININFALKLKIRSKYSEIFNIHNLKVC